MNSLYQQINQQSQNNTQPQKLTVQDIMREVQNSGMSAKDLFFSKAKQMGIDPNSILSQLR